MAIKIQTLQCRKLKLNLFVLLFSLCNFAFAADTGVILQQENELKKFKDLPRNIPESKPLQENQAEDKAEGPKVLVSRIKFNGNEVFTEDQLLKKLEVFLNQELTFKQIQNLATIISDFYHQEGFFLAVAIIPKQEVIDGVIEMIIQEGQLDANEPLKINDKGAVGTPLRLSKDAIYAYIINPNKLKLKQADLERGILNLNDNPGITSAANIEAGGQQGTSRIALDVAEGPKWDASLSADNFGSRFTGEDRISANLNINNPLSFGDKFSFNTVKAIEEPFHLNRVAYNFPIMRDGLRADISYSDLNYTLGKTLRTNPPSSGGAENWMMNLKYPLYRTAEKALFIGGGYDWKAIKTISTGEETANKRLDSYKANVSGQTIDKIFSGGFNLLDLSYTFGDLDLSRNATNLSNDQSAGQTNGSYQKTNAQFVRIQRGTDHLSFQFIYNQQWAFKNLDGAEKMILGGPAAVRAYPPGEAAGDEGHRVCLDAKYILATASKVGDVIGSLYYDYGKIYQYDNPSLVSETNNAYSLAGWGLGLDLISAGKYALKAGWAKKIGNNPGKSDEGNDSDGLNRDSRWWFQGTVYF